MKRARKVLPKVAAAPAKRGRGRPRQYGDELQATRSVRLPTSVWAELDRLAADEGVSAAEALRRRLGLPA